MKDLLERSSLEYAFAQEKRTDTGDDQGSIHHPAVFVFLGDLTADAIRPIAELNEKKWDNNAGVVYLHVCSNETVQYPNVVSFRIPEPEQADKKTLRKAIYDQFYKDGQRLFELNQTIRRLSNNVSEFGRLYSSFERIHISVITRVDDPLNVLMPEITLLMQTIFALSFKVVQSDLYALIREREEGEGFGYAAAAGFGFLRELETVQDAEYAFEAELQVTGEGVRLPVVHRKSPLFDLVYLLSDKKESGIATRNRLTDNYEIICHIHLLKNRNVRQVPDNGVETYNNTMFKNQIMSQNARHAYVTAGFFKMKRPNQAIFLAVVYHFYNSMLAKIQSMGNWNKREVLELFELDPPSLDRLVERIVPDDDTLRGMTALMHRPVRFGDLKRVTVKEAEAMLFGDSCETYFQHNFVEAANAQLDDLNMPELMERTILEIMKRKPGIGLYSLYVWTDENNEETGILEEIRRMARETAKDLEEAKAQLELLYQERVEEQTFQRVPLMDKTNTRNFIRCFFARIYGYKTEMLRLQTRLSLLRRYETELARVHQAMSIQMSALERLRLQLLDIVRENVKQADDYIGQNVFEYYQVVTREIVTELETKRGEHFYFDERYVGNVLELLREGTTEELVRRIVEVCKGHVLTAGPFMESFEQELLQRTNVAVGYYDRQVLTKDELFKELYNGLNQNAEVHLRLFHYTQEHRYEERYFFGDTESEFLHYALRIDEASRTYKLGCVHETGRSGIAKLHLMGGFHLEDVMYCRNAQGYYDRYCNEGYEFHGVSAERLAAIR